MIEPDQHAKPSAEPINDELTHMTQALYEKTTNGTRWRGWHTTKCGKTSDNDDHVLPNGVITHSLAVYYMQHYRHAIPESEIEKTKKLYNELIQN